MKKWSIFSVVLIVAFFILLVVFYFGAVLFVVPLTGFRIVIGILAAVLISCFIAVGVSRIREIKSENKDDYKKY